MLKTLAERGWISLAWLHKLFAGNNCLPHISENNTTDEKNRRLATLSDEEQKAYKWLSDGYSEAWTAETLGLEIRDAKGLFDSVYHKLGVKSSRELILCYAAGESTP